MQLSTIFLCAVLIPIVISEVKVSTKDGDLVGIVLKSSRAGKEYYAFRGIPYAEPFKRFESSKPVKKWNDLKNATSYGSPCPQMFGTTEPIGEEDCLFINVATPTVEASAGLDVMVWIHGGGLQFGHSSEFDPDYFMDDGNVVLVTINYRLGVLGFLSTGDSVLPGNLGLKDQRLALQWVKKNIKAFGGDPGKVTIFGESAGGASVNYHMISKSTKGLFQRAIAMSGSALNPWAIQKEPEANLRRLLEKTGCLKETIPEGIECLKALPMKDIIKAQTEFMEWIIYPFMTFTVVVEPKSVKDAILTDTPYSIMKAGKVHNVPYLTGMMAHEGLLFSAPAFINPSTLDDLNKDFERIGPMVLLYDQGEKGKEISRKVEEAYFGDDKGSLTVDDLKKGDQLLGDRWIYNGVISAAETLSQHVPVFTYVFSFLGEFSCMKKYWGVEELHGATHADELQYLFKEWTGLPPLSERNEKTQELAKKFMKSFVQFAKTGVPAGWGNNSKWEPFQAGGNGPWYKIDETTGIEDVEPIIKRRKMWTKLLGIDELKKENDLRVEL